MKKLIFTTLFAALFLACFAQKPRMVVFYIPKVQFVYDELKKML